MTELSRGANAPVSGPMLDLAVSGARQGAVDLMVFQLAADRKVRSDADFVFFNQSSSPEGGVRLTAADRVHLDLAAVPPAVEVLAVAVSLDDSVPGGLSGINGLGVAITGPADAYTAPAAGLTSERAAVLVEIYRRQGAWKVRNVSAGWTAGLPALAREHGVVVDDTPAPFPAAPAPPLPVVPADPPAPAGPAYPPPSAPAYPAVPSSPAYPPPAASPYPVASAYPGAPASPPSVAPGYPPVPAGPAYSPAAAAGYPSPAGGQNPALPPVIPPGPPAGVPAPGGYPLPGGSPAPSFAGAPRTGPGGWPPPGGDLRAAPLPPPPGYVAGYPPPGGA